MRVAFVWIFFLLVIGLNPLAPQQQPESAATVDIKLVAGSFRGFSTLGFDVNGWARVSSTDAGSLVTSSEVMLLEGQHREGLARPVNPNALSRRLKKGIL